MRSVSMGSKVAAAGLSLALVGIVGCGKKSSSSSLPAKNKDCPTTAAAPKPVAAPTVDRAKVKAGGTVTFAIDQEPTGWNVNTATDNEADLAYLTTMVYPQPFITLPDFKVVLDKNLFTSVEQTSSSPQTIVWKLNPKAVWSDGTPISADDFIYNWKMQNGSIAGVDAASTTGYDQIKSITPSDGGKTFTMVFTSPYPDWKGLFANLMPAHILKDAKGWGMVDKQGNPSGLLHDTAAPTWSAGPYMFQNYKPKKSVEMVPNPKYWGNKPLLDKIIVRFDVADLPPAFQNNEISFAYPQPQLDDIALFKKDPNLKVYVNFGLSFEHLDLNLGNPLLKDVAVRKAIYLGLNRYTLVQKTVGQFDSRAQTLENRMWVNNQPEYEAHADGCKDFDPEKAVKTLEDAGYKKGADGYYAKGGKTLSFKITTTGGNKLRETTEQLIVDQMKAIGIKITISNKEGATVFDDITASKYDIALFAWVAGPFPTSNESIYKTKGGQNWNNYSNTQLDAVLHDMVTTPDHAKEVADTQAADKILWTDMPTIPLYQKPTMVVYAKNLVNVQDDASNQGPLWNAQDWGTGQVQ